MNSRSTKKRHAGVSMVEVLVALVVIGTGMMGIASLYAITLQAKTTSLSRMEAVNLANDMADRIRANRTAPSSDYAVAEGTVLSAPGTTCLNTTTTAPTTNCTATQMAKYDLLSWTTQLLNTLPGMVKRSIVVTSATATAPAIYTITIKWSEPGVTNLSYALQVQI